LRKEEVEKRKEEDKRERLEKIKLEKVKKEERKRLEEEDRKKKEEEELKKQMAEQQAQMKRLLEEEVKIPQVFDGTSSKVSRYVEDCRRYTERKIKEKTEKDKICWIVSYVQGDQIDKWKERIVDEMFEDKWKVER